MAAPSAKGRSIAVAAGKGGTGKTLIATSLAVALARGGYGPVQLLDCDVEEPNAALLLRPTIREGNQICLPTPKVDDEACTGCGRCAEVCQFNAIAVMRGQVVTFPGLCNGCGACVYACPAKAIKEVARPLGVVEEGVTADGILFCHGRVEVGVLQGVQVIQAVKRRLTEGTAAILDAPPGTACPMQETVAESDYCLLVTEPTPFGLSDLRAAVETCAELAVPCGVILNRADEDGEAVEGYCQEAGLPLLLRIPERREIAEAYARGETLAHAFPKWQADLCQVFEVVSTLIEERR